MPKAQSMNQGSMKQQAESTLYYVYALWSVSSVRWIEWGD